VNAAPRCLESSAERRLDITAWAGLLALALAVTVPLHGWPMSDSASLRFFWLANCVVLVWCAVALVRLRTREGRDAFAAFGPPECIWACIVVGLLSVATADDLVRAGTSAAKTALLFAGTYSLTAAACRRAERSMHILWILTVGASACVAHAWIQRATGPVPVSFFESPLKFGSFLAMVVPASFVYLSRSQRLLPAFGAGVLLLAAMLVCASFWAVLGMLVGCLGGGLCHPHTRRRAALGVPVVALIVVAAVWAGRHPALAADAGWMEADGPDLKQRYIEWQAQVNLLSDRAAVGTGAGCLNDYRSFYYGRLPKNNTIAPFDQNGWLAAAAETSLLGLASLCWIFGHFALRAMRRRGSPLVHAAGAALAGVAVAQIASSIFYNGILVLFVMFLALIEHGPAREEP